MDEHGLLPEYSSVFEHSIIANESILACLMAISRQITPKMNMAIPLIDMDWKLNPVALGVQSLLFFDVLSIVSNRLMELVLGGFAFKLLGCQCYRAMWRWKVDGSGILVSTTWSCMC